MSHAFSPAANTLAAFGGARTRPGGDVKSALCFISSTSAASGLIISRLLSFSPTHRCCPYVWAEKNLCLQTLQANFKLAELI